MIFFAFCIPSASGTLLFNDPTYSPSILKSLVTAAHSNSVRVVLSVGGWSGSQNFSSVLASPALRSTLVDSCVQIVKMYDLDGLDIDYEYPGEPGAGNKYAEGDVANLLGFLKALRGKVGKGKSLSLAVPTGRIWQGQSSVKAFAKVVKCGRFTPLSLALG